MPLISYLEARRQAELNASGHITPQSPPTEEQLDSWTGSQYENLIAQLAPISVIQHLLMDWFELVHPVAPILHRDTFLQRFHEHAERPDLEFSALVVSICSATVATLRRTATAYASMVTVENCWNIISAIDQLRGPLPVSLIRCQWKYNMAVSTFQERGMDDEIPQLLMMEATGMVGRLMHYDLQGMSLRDRELCKRLYWLCFAGQWWLYLDLRRLNHANSIQYRWTSWAALHGPSIRFHKS